MKREIKFRAWHTDSKILFDVLAIAFQNKQIVVKWHGAERAIETKQFELMQFSGLTDKNGIEVYEGDIVLMDSKFTLEVVFGIHSIGSDSWDIPHVSPMFCGKFKDNSGFTGLDLSHDYEVIGNVHQNPELI